MLLLALFTLASLCVFAKFVCHDPQGFGTMLHDRETVARGRPRHRRDMPRLGRYSLAVC